MAGHRQAGAPAWLGCLCPFSTLSAGAPQPHPPHWQGIASYSPLAHPNYAPAYKAIQLAQRHRTGRAVESQKQLQARLNGRRRLDDATAAGAAATPAAGTPGEERAAAPVPPLQGGGGGGGGAGQTPLPGSGAMSSRDAGASARSDDDDYDYAVSYDPERPPAAAAAAAGALGGQPHRGMSLPPLAVGYANNPMLQGATAAPAPGLLPRRASQLMSSQGSGGGGGVNFRYAHIMGFVSAAARVWGRTPLSRAPAAPSSYQDPTLSTYEEAPEYEYGGALASAPPASATGAHSFFHYSYGPDDSATPSAPPPEEYEDEPQPVEQQAPVPPTPSALVGFNFFASHPPPRSPAAGAGARAGAPSWLRGAAPPQAPMGRVAGSGRRLVPLSISAGGGGRAGGGTGIFPAPVPATAVPAAASNLRSVPSRRLDI